MQINSAKDLNVYKKAYALSMVIFHLSKEWPKDEKYSLTSDLRSQTSDLRNWSSLWHLNFIELSNLSKTAEVAAVRSFSFRKGRS